MWQIEWFFALIIANSLETTEWRIHNLIEYVFFYFFINLLLGAWHQETGDCTHRSTPKNEFFIAISTFFQLTDYCPFIIEIFTYVFELFQSIGGYFTLTFSTWAEVKATKIYWFWKMVDKWKSLLFIRPVSV